VRLAQIGANIVVEGQARTIDQVSNIVASFSRISTRQGRPGNTTRQVNVADARSHPTRPPSAAPGQPANNGMGSPYLPGGMPPRAGRYRHDGQQPRTSHQSAQSSRREQVMLKVRIAELNRTASANRCRPFVCRSKQRHGFRYEYRQQSNYKIGALSATYSREVSGSTTTAFGVFPNDFDILIRALR
jgi:Flp pilus assembly secretin CpaC